jgi:hypothetical protein
VAGAGEEAPGTGGKAFQFLDAPHFCATGQVVFSATVGTAIRGVWVTDELGELHLLALAGAKLPGGGGKVVKDVTIASVGGSTQSGGGDGRMRAINNKGEVVFYCGFEDGTYGAFVGRFGGK